MSKMTNETHLDHPFSDHTLCGDADDGIDIPTGAPLYGSQVTCEKCLAIIDHCIDYSRNEKRKSKTKKRREEKNDR